MFILRCKGTKFCAYFLYSTTKKNELYTRSGISRRAGAGNNRRAVPCRHSQQFVALREHPPDAIAYCYELIIKTAYGFFIDKYYHKLFK